MQYYSILAAGGSRYDVSHTLHTEIREDPAPLTLLYTEEAAAAAWRTLYAVLGIATMDPALK